MSTKKKKFGYKIIDPPFSKSLEVDTSKIKTFSDLKKKIASDLHISDSNIKVENPPIENKLKNIYISREFKISFPNRCADIEFTFPDNSNITIQKGYRMDFDQIINSFRNKGLYYSNECKNYIQFKILGRDVPNITYPFLAVPYSSKVNVEINRDVVVLRYGYNKFIFIDDEPVSNAFVYIKNVYKGSFSVSIQKSISRSKLNYNDRLKKYIEYIVRVDYKMTFKGIDHLLSYTVYLDYLSTVFDAKRELVRLITFNTQLDPENISIFNENKQKVFDNRLSLRRIQKLQSIFYYDIDKSIKSSFSYKELIDGDSEFMPNYNNNTNVKSTSQIFDNFQKPFYDSKSSNFLRSQNQFSQIFEIDQKPFDSKSQSPIGGFKNSPQINGYYQKPFYDSKSPNPYRSQMTSYTEIDQKPLYNTIGNLNDIKQSPFQLNDQRQTVYQKNSKFQSNANNSNNNNTNNNSPLFDQSRKDPFSFRAKIDPIRSPKFIQTLQISDEDEESVELSSDDVDYRYFRARVKFNDDSQENENENENKAENYDKNEIEGNNDQKTAQENMIENKKQNNNNGQEENKNNNQINEHHEQKKIQFNSPIINYLNAADELKKAKQNETQNNQQNEHHEPKKIQFNSPIQIYLSAIDAAKSNQQDEHKKQNSVVKKTTTSNQQHEIDNFIIDDDDNNEESKIKTRQVIFNESPKSNESKIQTNNQIINKQNNNDNLIKLNENKKTKTIQQGEIRKAKTIQSIDIKDRKSSPNKIQKSNQQNEIIIKKQKINQQNTTTTNDNQKPIKINNNNQINDTNNQKPKAIKQNNNNNNANDNQKSIKINNQQNDINNKKSTSNKSNNNNNKDDNQKTIKINNQQNDINNQKTKPTTNKQNSSNNNSLDDIQKLKINNQKQQSTNNQQIDKLKLNITNNQQNDKLKLNITNNQQNDNDNQQDELIKSPRINNNNNKQKSKKSGKSNKRRNRRTSKRKEINSYNNDNLFKTSQKSKNKRELLIKKEPNPENFDDFTYDENDDYNDIEISEDFVFYEKPKGKPIICEIDDEFASSSLRMTSVSNFDDL